ncbi:rho guanyl nucleotide exchange [Moniliophthora roreri MCA 2997]|uniref:Rho guanyl nucleotide exchange n=1 Tax=Moniliophthora roreri (strain MCA 2997) TaxID=1381753 RepID=V2WFC1_MONRO|nr:rho guanyl nucleotide exchange [Moniliophthora roreri MCA 2997]
MSTSTPDEPRSRRVGMARPPTEFSLSNLLYIPSSPPSSPVTPSPPIPARSPLRPPPRSSISTNTTYSSAPVSTDQRLSSGSSFSAKLPTPPPSEGDFDPTTMTLSFQVEDGDDTHFPSLSGILQGVIPEAMEVAKTVPIHPESPLALSPMDDEATSSSSSLAGQPGQTTPLTKRQHALLELLSSERAYASDLALVRAVYIPLALGHPAPLNTSAPITPPHSSASSSRTMSTASDSSTSSLGAPMTSEDAKIIFNNIADLALFSDMFCDKLQDALGSVLDGGVGDDHVGELFLQIIPEMERPYKQYITRQGTADEHLQNLPKTPALENYFAQARMASTSVSHAWDLHSLLIKPVQRLLKYPLLLGTILEATPDSHPDKENLRLAKAKIEDVARSVNEERRRAEVVKGILMGDPKKKASNATIGVAASVNLSKMKSLKKAVSSSQASLDAIGNGGASGSAEAAKVDKMAVELRRIEVFAQQFAKNVVDWSKSMNVVVRNLRMWAVSFGKVIGLSEDQGSEAFDAFLQVLEQHLAPLCAELEMAINEKLLKEIARLLTTMKHPLKLLASMDEQEPYHHHLLNMNVSAKNRPPAALLEASTNYLALRGQLAAELPKYIELMHRGMANFVLRLAEIQVHYWMDVRDRWSDLWDMLRVEGEMNGGAEETIAVWYSRWLDVDETLKALRITSMQKMCLPPESKLSHSISGPPAYHHHPPMPAPIAEHYMQQQPYSSQSPPQSPPPMKRTTSSAVTSVLSSLDPSHISTPQISPPYALSPTPSRKNRGRGHSDASNAASSASSKRSLGKRGSVDSLKSSGKSVNGKPPRPHADEWEDFFVPAFPPGITAGAAAFSLPRTKSMPLPKANLGLGSAAGSESYRLPQVDTSPVGEAFMLHLHQQEMDGEDDDRGRTSRKPSFKRKISETLRSHSGDRPPRPPQQTRPSSSKGASSSSVPDKRHTAPAKGRSSLPAPTPTTSAPLPQPTPTPSMVHAHSFSDDISNRQRRDSWSQAPGKYTCQVLHPCRPPAPVSYQGFPFFTLVEGDFYAVLYEAGHPSLHKKLPLYVDDGEDCLLLCRNKSGTVGWALASFLEPLGPFS